MRFGLEDGSEYTLEEVGRAGFSDVLNPVYGVSED